MSAPAPALATRLRKLFTGPGLAAVLGRGAVGSLVASGLGALAGVASHMLLARLLGVDAFGHYSYAWTIVSLLTIVGTLGFDTALVRFVAAYRVEERWGALSGLLAFSDRVVLAAGFGVGAVAALVVLALRGRLDPALAATLWAGCLVLPVYCVVGLRAGSLQGLRRVVLSKVPDVVLRPLFTVAVALGLFALLGGASAPLAMLATLGAAVLSLAVGSWLMRRQGLPTPAEPAERHDREWLRVSLPLLFVSGMRLLLNQSDILLLGLMVGTREAGIYTAASRLGQLITFGQNAVNGIAAPLISELHAQGQRTRLQRMVTLTSWGATLWALAATLGLVVAGIWLLGLWGEAFQAAWPALVVLGVGQVVNAAAGPVGYLLNMTGHQDENARILAWVVGLNLVLAAPAIYLWGALGAAFATSLVTVLKNVWTWRAVRKHLGINSSVFGRAVPSP